MLSQQPIRPNRQDRGTCTGIPDRYGLGLKAATLVDAAGQAGRSHSSHHATTYGQHVGTDGIPASVALTHPKLQRMAHRHYSQPPPKTASAKLQERANGPVVHSHDTDANMGIPCMPAKQAAASQYHSGSVRRSPGRFHFPIAG